MPNWNYMKQEEAPHTRANRGGASSRRRPSRTSPLLWFGKPFRIPWTPAGMVSSFGSRSACRGSSGPHTLTPWHRSWMGPGRTRKPNQTVCAISPSRQDRCVYVTFEDFGTSGLEGNPSQWCPEDGVENGFFNFFLRGGAFG